jgi:hypothetical protein
MKDFRRKISSGSSRDKFKATAKQNKWDNPFYAYARGMSINRLHTHKRNSIQESSLDSAQVNSTFKAMLSSVAAITSRLFRRKVIA